MSYILLLCWNTHQTFILLITPENDPPNNVRLLTLINTHPRLTQFNTKMESTKLQHNFDVVARYIEDITRRREEITNFIFEW
jgi:hypothetical protein